MNHKSLAVSLLFLSFSYSTFAETTADRLAQSSCKIQEHVAKKNFLDLFQASKWDSIPKKLDKHIIKNYPDSLSLGASINEESKLLDKAMKSYGPPNINGRTFSRKSMGPRDFSSKQLPTMVSYVSPGSGDTPSLEIEYFGGLEVTAAYPAEQFKKMTSNMPHFKNFLKSDSKSIKLIKTKNGYDISVETAETAIKTTIDSFFSRHLDLDCSKKTSVTETETPEVGIFAAERTSKGKQTGNAASPTNTRSITAPK